MTRLVTTGFETGDSSDFSLVNGAIAIVSSSPTPATGGYCARVGGGGGNYCDLYPFAGTDVIYGFMRVLSLGDSYGCFLKILDADKNVLITFEYTAAGKLSVYRGDGAALLATSTNQVFFYNVWAGVEFYILIDDSAGRVIINVDGVANVIDFTGDTKQSSAVNMVYARLFCGSYRMSFDDLVINDDAGSSNNTYPGQVKLLPFRPTGAGDNTGLTPSSGNNWDCVNEVPASAVDYVYDTVPDDYDLYAAADPSIPDGAVLKNVIVIAHSAYDSGSGNIAPMMKSGSTSVQSADQALIAAYRPYEFCRALDPNGDIAWTVSAVNALQIGVKVR
jgi:hypothetical protein